VDKKICLDSDILIEISKNNTEVIEKLRKLDANIYTTPINIFEIWAGRFKKEENSVKKLINNLKKINFDEQSSLKAADIQLELKKTGQNIDFRDIFIASICIQNDIPLFTKNKKHFERLTKFGLKLI
jgi:tRNA(fMet)-specific endonuclease VapC